MPAGIDRNAARVRATLTTKLSRVGIVWLDSVAPVAWDGDGDDEVVVARLEVVAGDEVKQELLLTGAAWSAFQDEADMQEFLEDLRSCGLESSLRAQLDSFENHYEHEDCGVTWIDNHSCGCDDECPSCGASISPHDSIQLAGLDDEAPAGYMNLLERQPMPQEAAVARLGDRPGASR